jgi:hypothetical protein
VRSNRCIRPTSFVDTPRRSLHPAERTHLDVSSSASAKDGRRRHRQQSASAFQLCLSLAGRLHVQARHAATEWPM